MSTVTAKSKITKSKTKSKLNTNLIKITQHQIDELISDPTYFILNNDANTLLDIIKYTADKYYNDQAIIPDDVYDLLIDTIKDLDPDNLVLKQIGATVLSKNKVKLKYFMGSMDKIKPSDQSVLSKWLDKYKGPYVYSDKLDGVSGLLIYSNNKFKLYTRGDGLEGTDISNLIKYIPTIVNIDKSKLENNMAIRGELIISKSKFDKYADQMANARNMVSGIVNSKTIDINTVADVDFIVYELINPWNKNQQQQWEILSNAGFKVAPYGSNVSVDFTNLSKILEQRKEVSEYEIDGIIISNNILPTKRSTNSNPDYAFAFKDSSLLQTANVEVISVEWSISKDRYIKPTLKLTPTKLSGVTISSVTALHAKYVKDNILGPGAIIELIRSGDVIPKIQKVLKPATSGKPQLPDIEYEWTGSGVDIIATDGGIDHIKKELTFFFKKLEIANVDESTVKKMIDVGIDSINDIIDIKESDLAKVEGFKEKMIQKIYTNITNRIQNLTMLDLMHASNVFGHGIGERKLYKVMESYPDIIKLYTDNSEEEIIDLIKKLDGFDVKTAEYFTTGLDKFIELFNGLKPEMRKQLRLSTYKFIEEQENKDNLNNNRFMGKTIVFSGFRNKEWQTLIESNGGKVGTSISSKTTLLITTSEELIDTSNSKVIKAKELNIPILTREQFETEYILK